MALLHVGAFFMAEGEVEKEEEKFELDLLGEALDHISQEQVRTLAIRYASDNTAFCGGRYAHRELA